MSFGFGMGFPRSAPAAGGPSLNLQFAGSTTLDPIITFTRASTATYFDSTGTLTTAAINAPRLDYNPSTLAAQGLLVEEQRVNSLRNNTMVGAVAGTPGTAPTSWTVQINTTTGLTTQVVGTGTESGVTYIDLRVSGTASGAGTLDVFFENASAVAALTGQTWTGSVYTKLQAGSLTGISSPTFRLYEYTSGVVFVTGQIGAIATPTTAGLATQRTTATLTTNGGATVAAIRPLINYVIANGAVIDITLRVGLPQLELGAFATSVIPTSTVAVTRAADFANITNLSPWYNAEAYTLFGQALASNSNPLASQVLVSLNDGTINNRFNLLRGIGSIAQAGLSLSNVTTFASGTIAWPASTAQKLAVSAQAGQQVFAVAGSLPAPQGTSAIFTAAQMAIGSRADGSVPFNGWIQQVGVYPRVLSPAELQAITA